MTKGCPTCGHIPSNSRTHLQLDVPVSMLLSMMHTLAVGRNTEMMCSNQEAADELEKLRKIVFDNLGPSHKYFRERDWTKIMLGAAAGATLEVQAEKKPKAWNQFHVRVRVDDKIYYSENPNFRDDKVAEEKANHIVDLLKEDIDRLYPM